MDVTEFSQNIKLNLDKTESWFSDMEQLKELNGK